jgi:hypothetical protein
MQTVVWTPRLFLAACALAMGVVAATPDGSADDSGSADDAAAPGDATVGDASPVSAGEGGATEASTDDGPDPATWPGPPSNDGALDDGSLPTFDGGEVLDYLGVCQAVPTPYSYTTVLKPYPDTAGCMAFDSQGHPAAHNCYCQKCFDLVQQCDALPGCKAIAKCFEDSGCATNKTVCALVDAVAPKLGCTPTVTCYFAPGAPCTTTIDAWGNGSVSTGLWSMLETCGQSNSCPTQ